MQRIRKVNLGNNELAAYHKGFKTIVGTRRDLEAAPIWQESHPRMWRQLPKLQGAAGHLLQSRRALCGLPPD
jgi:hypothetical protein